MWFEDGSYRTSISPPCQVVPCTLRFRSCSVAIDEIVLMVKKHSWSGPKTVGSQTASFQVCAFWPSWPLTITRFEFESPQFPPRLPFGRLKLSSTGVVGNWELAS